MCTAYPDECDSKVEEHYVFRYNISAQISALYFSLASQRQCHSKIIDGSWNRPLGAHVAEVNNECVPYAWSALVPN